MECYDFGLRLKQLRQNLGLTQEKLALKLGLTKASISGYENNTAFPPIDVLRRMAYIFSVSTDYILGVDNKEYILLDGLSSNQKKIVTELIEEFLIQNRSN